MTLTPSYFLEHTHSIVRQGPSEGTPSVCSYLLWLFMCSFQSSHNVSQTYLYAYAGEGNILVRREIIPSILAFLETEGKPIGFFINLRKTIAWFPRQLQNPLTMNLPCSIKHGGPVNVLGSPVGNDDACRELLKKRIHEVFLFWSRLVEINDSQIAYHLLRLCASTCKIIYTMRSTSTHIISSDINTFDIGMRGPFEEIHGATITKAWLITTFPHMMGGLGLIEAQTIANICYISSIVSCRQLIQGLLPYTPFSPTTNLMEPHASMQQQWNLSSDFSLTKLLDNSCVAVDLQKDMTHAVQLKRLKKYLPDPNSRTSEDIRIHSRATATANPTSSRVFSTLPDSRLKTAVSSPLWRTMVLHRLGNPVFPGDSVCLLCRRSNRRNEILLDQYGHHASVFPCADGSTRRHNSLRDFLYNYIRCNGMGLTVRKEEPLPQDTHLPGKCTSSSRPIH